MRFVALLLLLTLAGFSGGCVSQAMNTATTALNAASAAEASAASFTNKAVNKVQQKVAEAVECLTDPETSLAEKIEETSKHWKDGKTRSLRKERPTIKVDVLKRRLNKKKENQNRKP